MLLKKHRVTLYWLYLRAINAPGLFKTIDEDTARKIAPEQIVHRFFLDTGLPYRAFSAEDPQALEEAIAEVDALQTLPIRYRDIIPKRDLAHACFAIGLALLAVYGSAKALELKQWH